MPLKKLLNAKLIARIVAISFWASPLVVIWDVVLSLVKNYPLETVPTVYFFGFIFFLSPILIGVGIWAQKPWGYVAGFLYAVVGILIYLLDFPVNFSDISTLVFLSPFFLGPFLLYVLIHTENKLLWKKFIQKSILSIILLAFNLLTLSLIVSLFSGTYTEQYSFTILLLILGAAAWIFPLIGWLVWGNLFAQIKKVIQKIAMTTLVQRFNNKKTPWIRVWLYPRETIQRKKDTTSLRTLFLLILLANIQNILDVFSRQELFLSDVSQTLLLPIMLVTILTGAFIVLILSLAIWWIGKLLKGVATSLQTLTAVAWSYVPLIALLPFQILHLVFQFSDTPLSLASSILTIWTFVILLQMVSEIHGFSMRKTLAVVIPSMIITAIVALLNSYILFSVFPLATTVFLQ